MISSFLVTGAAGCVGRALFERLAAEGTCPLVGIDRSPAPWQVPRGAWHACDILEPAAYAPTLRGIDTVVHLAAKVHAVPRTAGEAEEFNRINVEGTRLLIGAAAAAGVRRFLYVSTVATLLPRREILADAYADSKRQAEAIVLEYRERMDVVVILPATVYGPYDRGNMYRLIRWIDRGLPAVIGPGTNRKSMVFVRTLADAIIFLARHGRNTGRYVVADERVLTLNEIVETIGRSLGRRYRWPAIPLPVARAACRVAGWLTDGFSARRLLELDAVEKIAREAVFDSTPLYSLGFSPSYDFAAGIEETVRWYRDSVL